MEKPSTALEYINSIQNGKFRAELLRIRNLILSEYPDVEEKISYGMPTYKLKNGYVCFGAFKNHLSFFPGSAIDDFVDQVSEFKTSRGTLQFSPEHPIPNELLFNIMNKRFFG